jgi:hypothetical protein
VQWPAQQQQQQLQQPCCYTTKCDRVEDGLMECASEATPHFRVTWETSGEIGNLVVKVDVKENTEEGSIMANTELLKA